MLYYQGYTVSFQEVPDETSLAILVGDCPHRCPGCHSPELQRPEGEDLEKNLGKIIDEYQDAITCVCFMGEGRDLDALWRCILKVKKRNKKVCLYTGYNIGLLYSILPMENGFRQNLPLYLDYLKVGPFIEKMGGLDSPTTNQVMYRSVRLEDDHHVWEDITYKFQKKKD